MSQMYAEAGVKRKDTLSTTALRGLLILGMIVGVLVVMLGSYFSFIGIALIAIMIFIYPRLNVEYEYVFVDGQIDFDRISGKTKRKTILRIDMEQVEIVAQEGSHALDGYTHVSCEHKDFSSGSKDNRPYIIIANVKEKKFRIAFEPTEKMLSLMKQKSPRKISQI
jgi:hypothetical protein